MSPLLCLLGLLLALCGAIAGEYRTTPLQSAHASSPPAWAKTVRHHEGVTIEPVILDLPAPNACSRGTFAELLGIALIVAGTVGVLLISSFILRLINPQLVSPIDMRQILSGFFCVMVLIWVCLLSYMMISSIAEYKDQRQDEIAQELHLANDRFAVQRCEWGAPATRLNYPIIKTLVHLHNFVEYAAKMLSEDLSCKELEEIILVKSIERETYWGALLRLNAVASGNALYIFGRQASFLGVTVLLMFFLMAMLMISIFLCFSRPRRKRKSNTRKLEEKHVEHTPGANKQEKTVETTKEEKRDGGEESGKEDKCTRKSKAEDIEEIRKPVEGSSTSEPIASEESDEEGEKHAN